MCLPRILRYFIAQSDIGIGNMTPNGGLEQMAMPMRAAVGPAPYMVSETEH